MRNAFIICILFLMPSLGFSESYYGYECTDDCSGHEAGYEWAEDNDIDDEYDCTGNSNSFMEGCQSFVEENEEGEDNY